MAGDVCQNKVQYFDVLTYIFGNDLASFGY